MSREEVSLMEERAKFVSLADSGKQSYSSLCLEFGISRKIEYKRLEGMREHDLAGLKEISRKRIALRCCIKILGTKRTGLKIPSSKFSRGVQGNWHINFAIFPSGTAM